jgi:Ni/Co efflux regulator RcnB
MKLKALVAALIATALAGGGIVFAQSRDEHKDHAAPARAAAPAPRAAARPAARPAMAMRADPHAGERGAGPSHDFRRGGRLPTEYRNNQYVVDDWQNHHLRRPPNGYHWVQTGGDYVLAAVATGIIADILLDH